MRSHVIVRMALPAELAEIGDIRVAAYQADGYLPATSGYASTLRRLGTVGDGDILVAVDDGSLSAPSCCSTGRMRVR